MSRNEAEAPSEEAIKLARIFVKEEHDEADELLLLKLAHAFDAFAKGHVQVWREKLAEQSTKTLVLQSKIDTLAALLRESM